MNLWPEIAFAEDPLLAMLFADSVSLQNRIGQFTLADVNSVLSAYGAVATHAWGFSATSGAEPDLASSSPISLTPAGTGGPTQGVSTGLAGGDLGVQMTDNSDHRMSAGAAGDLDVAGGDLWYLAVVRFAALPGGTRHILLKSSASSLYDSRILNTGVPQCRVGDGVDIVTAPLTSSHVGTHYNLLLSVLDRTAVRLSFTSQLEDSGLVDTTAVGSLTNAGTFSVGRSVTAAGQIVSFLAWGTTIGTLQTNRVAAVAALKSAMGI